MTNTARDQVLVSRTVSRLGALAFSYDATFYAFSIRLHV